MNDEQRGNPYKSPHHDGAPPPEHSNPIAYLGFALSLLGFLGIVMVVGGGVLFNLGDPAGTTLGMSGFIVSFLSFPGLLLSFLGLFRTPRYLAVWGVGLGLLGSVNLPTLLTAFVVHPH